MQSYRITIEDMNCKNCANTIVNALQDSDDKLAVRVNLAKKQLEIDTELSIVDICDIIDETGFTFTSIDLM